MSWCGKSSTPSRGVAAMKSTSMMLYANQQRDAFFPFSDNFERAKKCGVSYVAQPGGSVRDAQVIECCDKYNMVMAFTGMRLFHH